MGSRVAAIVLAAGYSSRMGQFKPLLPLGKGTIAERVLDLFLESEVKDVRVVVGYRASELSPLLQKKGILCITNEDFEEGMFSSVVAGLRSLEPNTRAFFVLPVDIPLVRPQTIASLLWSYEKGMGEIIHPCFQGQRGHPPLISGRFVEGILSWNGEGGLQSFLERHEHHTVDVAVADEFILFDLDTPADYERLLQKYERYENPTPKECLALMTEIFAVDKTVLDHCEAVARVATRLGTALNKAGCEMDLDLLFAGGLLHDLARSEPQHATVAAQTLDDMGFPKVADVVSAHMDIVIYDEDPIDEKEVLYLADKLVQGHQVVPLESRFEKMMEQYAEDPSALKAIELRFRNAFLIQQRLEATTGKSLEKILKKRPLDHSDDLFD